MRWCDMEEKNLREKLLGIPLVLMVVLVIFSICTTSLLRQILWKNTKETNENYLSHYMTEIEKSLDSYRLMVANNGIKQEILKRLQSEEQKDVFHAKVSLTKEWSHLLELYPEIDGIYLMWGEEAFFFINPKSNYGLQSLARTEIQSWAKTLPEGKNPFEDRWEILGSEEQGFLNCAVLQENCMFGVWISKENFLNFFQEYREEEEKDILFLKKEEVEAKKELLSEKYFIITQYFKGEDFGLSLLIEKENIFGTVRPVLWIFLSLSAVGLVILVIYIWFLYKAILQIEDLNHKIYEEKILKLRLRGQLLELQIKPHFFLNSLSNILSFLYVGEIKLAEDMIVHLANHIRYLLNHDRFVCLADEIHHVKNYMAMQSLRFGPNFSCKISVSPELEKCLIPILSIQTFVENSIKYAQSSDGKVCIFLSAFSVKVKEESYIKILIEDDAGGFQPEILEKLQKGEEVYYGNRKHIGISNVRERISLLYGTKGQLVLSNSKMGGALVELFFPLTYRDEKSE